jgi:hypothetical protein
VTEINGKKKSVLINGYMHLEMCDEVNLCFIVCAGQYMGSNKNTIIVSATVVGGSMLALLILTSSFLLWKVKRDKYNLLLEVQQSKQLHPNLCNVTSSLMSTS